MAVNIKNITLPNIFRESTEKDSEADIPTPYFGKFYMCYEDGGWVLGNLAFGITNDAYFLCTYAKFEVLVEPGAYDPTINNVAWNTDNDQPEANKEDFLHACMIGIVAETIIKI